MKLFSIPVLGQLLLTFLFYGSLMSTAYADGIGDLKPLPHDCRLAVIADDAPAKEREFYFEAPHIGPSYGGTEFEFKTGPYAVTVMADGKWLGIEWRKNGVVVAKSVALSAYPLPDERVLLVFNPQDDQQHVDLSCSRRKPPPVEVPPQL